METKSLNIESVEFKFDDEKKGVFSGYASVFNGVDSYGDTITAGAYKKTLKKRDRPVAMRWDHYGDVIGKWTAIAEDEKGLYVEGELTPGHSVAENVYASLKHGAISGLSIGYRPVKFTETGDGLRELKEIELIEISVVEEPADLAAQVGNIKSAIEDATSIKEIERALRDAGLSKSVTLAAIACIKTLVRGDHEAEKEAAELIATLKGITNRISE